MYHHFLTCSRIEEENVHRLQLYHNFPKVFLALEQQLETLIFVF